MAAESILAEAIARIEYKLDMILAHIGFMSEVPMMDPNGYRCPVCKMQATYQINLLQGVVERKCSCSTGKFVSAFTFTLTPAIPEPGKKDDSSNNTDVQPSRKEAAVKSNRR